jgi:futalosine hydrolase
MDPIDVAIIGAVSQEISGLTLRLESARAFSFCGETFFCGRYKELSLMVGTTGLGKVNAAAVCGGLLSRFPIARIWNIGCAGAYTGGPLRIGDVLVSDHIWCADEGVLAETGPYPISKIGIPLVVREGVAYDDGFPTGSDSLLRTFMNELPPGRYGQPESAHPVPATKPPGMDSDDNPETHDFGLYYGPSVTVAMVSGDPPTATARFGRYQGWAENMEGSAVAQTCLRFGVPMLECRGISNLAGDRNKANWQMEKSIAHCHGIVLDLLGLVDR